MARKAKSQPKQPKQPQQVHPMPSTIPKKVKGMMMDKQLHPNKSMMGGC